MKRLALLALLVAPSTGCVLYFGPDQGDDCDYNGGAAEPAIGLRNPQTGQCEYQGGGGGGGGGCVDGDRPLAGSGTTGSGTTDPGGSTGADEAAPLFEADWAQCESFCNGLDEFSCTASDGCRAIYVDICPPGSMCDGTAGFAACWATAPSGPIRGGDCSFLDAQTCSMHDDCSALHFGDFANGIGQFERCQNESAQSGGCYSDADCAPGEDCTADTECLPPPDCDPNTGMGCDSMCWGKCVAVDPGGCTDSSQCPMGQQCSIDPACMGGPGGNCTGMCVDPPPAPSCENADEATCIELIDGCVTYPDGTTACADIACVPLYEGTDCTCDAMGNCTCATWTYQSCSKATP